MKVKILALSLLAAAGVLVTACGDQGKTVTKSESSATTTSSSSSSAAQNNNVVSLDSVAKAPNVTKDSSFDERAAYAIGASVGTYITTIQNEQGEFLGPMNKDLIVKGFIDAVSGKSALSDDEISKTLVDLDSKVRAGLETKQKAEAADNLKAGQKFLEENAKKDGVKVTKSGLQYKVIKEGTGATPTANDVVKVIYKGTTIDGKVFDEQKDPIPFPLANIIPGWTEGLQLMKEGGETMLYIPANLAYGETGAGDVIKPNSVLIFDIKLVEVVKPDAKHATTPSTKPSDVKANAESSKTTVEDAAAAK